MKLAPVGTFALKVGLLGYTFFAGGSSAWDRRSWEVRIRRKALFVEQAKQEEIILSVRGGVGNLIEASSFLGTRHLTWVKITHPPCEFHFLTWKRKLYSFDSVLNLLVNLCVFSLSDGKVG